jgi:endonuclease/exonuclease/phosphatase family metal-dependent hydrolase
MGVKKRHRSTKAFRRWFGICIKCSGILIFCLLLYFFYRPEGELNVPGVGSQKPADIFRLKVLTWNVLRGNDAAFFMNTWRKRQRAFQAILEQSDYDIICLQEALSGQLTFFQEALTAYDYIGVGRADGQSGGEHTPVFYRRDRFELVASETFWLSPTPSVPSRGWGEFVPRICTWVELKDRKSQQRFRIYNTHLQLNPFAQFPAARMLAARAKVSPVPFVLLGDLNMPAQWPAFRPLKDDVFQSVNARGALTYHINGKGIRCLDHILFSGHWTIHAGGLLKEKFDGIYPSDHWGLWADLMLIQ